MTTSEFEISLCRSDEFLVTRMKSGTVQSASTRPTGAGVIATATLLAHYPKPELKDSSLKRIELCIDRASMEKLPEARESVNLRGSPNFAY